MFLVLLLRSLAGDSYRITSTKSYTVKIAYLQQRHGDFIDFKDQSFLNELISTN